MAEISPVDPEILSGADSSLVDFGYDNFLRDILLPDSNVLFNDLSPSTLLPQEPSFSYSNNRTKTLGLNEREDSGAGMKYLFQTTNMDLFKLVLTNSKFIVGLVIKILARIPVLPAYSRAILT